MVIPTVHTFPLLVKSLALSIDNNRQRETECCSWHTSLTLLLRKPESPGILRTSCRYLWIDMSLLPPPDDRNVIAMWRDDKASHTSCSERYCWTIWCCIANDNSTWIERGKCKRRVCQIWFFLINLSVSQSVEKGLFVYLFIYYQSIRQSLPGVF